MLVYTKGILPAALCVLPHRFRPLSVCAGGTGVLVYNKASGPLRGSTSPVFVHVGYDGWWLKVRCMRLTHAISHAGPT